MKTTTENQFAIEARKRVSEIARQTKNCSSSRYTAFYESENGYTVSTIQNGWETRTTTIDFGSYPLTKKQVLAVIEEWERDQETL